MHSAGAQWSPPKIATILSARSPFVAGRVPVPYPGPCQGVPKKGRPSHGAKVAAGGPWGGSHCRRSVLPPVSAAPGIHGPRSQCGNAGHALLPVALATGCVAGGQEDAEYHGTQVRWVLIFFWAALLLDQQNYLHS